MKLGIDTSHHVAVGLAEGHTPLDRLVIADTRAHLEHLVPSVMELLDRHGLTWADIDQVVVGMGPGPFTGLRVGIAAAHILASAGRVQEVRVCSLDVLALQWTDAPAQFVVASDARRKELYWAEYRDGRRVGEPQVSPPEGLPALPVAGAVPEAYRDVVAYEASAPSALDPAVLAALGDTLPPAPEEPYYLRPADAVVSGPPKSALPRLRASR